MPLQHSLLHDEQCGRSDEEGKTHPAAKRNSVQNGRKNGTQYTVIEKLRCFLYAAIWNQNENKVSVVDPEMKKYLLGESAHLYGCLIASTVILSTLAIAMFEKAKMRGRQLVISHAVQLAPFRINWDDIVLIPVEGGVPRISELSTGFIGRRYPITLSKLPSHHCRLN